MSAQAFLAAGVLVTAVVPGDAAAQVDTAASRVAHLDALVAVVDRTATRLRETVASTTLLTRADIDALPARTLPEVLRTVPGLTFVEQDGSGRMPIAVARGFFGGGETSYVLVTVDGVPVNDGGTGLVEWTTLPLSEVERIEVLRGSASAAYGDAALGAVVNVVTRGASADREEGGLSVASWDALGGRARITRGLADGRLAAAVDYGREEGYRAHSAWSRLASSVGWDRPLGDGRGSLHGGLSVRHVENEDPGPLTPEALEMDRRQNHPAFGRDGRDRTEVELTAGVRRSWAGGGHLEGDVRLRTIRQDRTRTLLLTPSFGDTQRHEARELGAWGRLQYGVPVAGNDLEIGGEVEADRYRSRYRTASGGPILSSGVGTRVEVGLWAQARRTVVSRLDLHAGVRFDAVAPDRQGGSGATFRQWSPRVGMNLAWRESPSSAGNVFATWTRAFKAPTLDQLYDPREIPSGEPGVTFNISNDALVPQRSSAFEVGVYQRLPLGGSDRWAELSASWYRQSLEDEIDFDVRTYRYGNIVRSRHTGIEASVRTVLSGRVRLEHAATLSRVTFRTVENRGNQLKNIPETSFVTSLQVDVAETLGLTVTHRARGRVFLDDENTEALPGVSLLDVGLRWSRRDVEVSLTARNVVDTRYGSLGFLLFDPVQSRNVRMVHPGGGRSVQVAVEVPVR